MDADCERYTRRTTKLHSAREDDVCHRNSCPPDRSQDTTIATQACIAYTAATSLTSQLQSIREPGRSDRFPSPHEVPRLPTPYSRQPAQVRYALNPFHTVKARWILPECRFVDLNPISRITHHTCTEVNLLCGIYAIWPIRGSTIIASNRDQFQCHLRVTMLYY